LGAEADPHSDSIARMLARRASSAISAAVVVVALTHPAGEAAAQSGGPSEVKACTTLAEDGQRLRAAGKLIAAREKLIACSAPVCPQVVRIDCAQWASEVLAATPTIVIDAKDPNGNDVLDAKAFVDDREVAGRIDGRPVDVDPGQHRVRVERADGALGSQVIVAKDSVKGRQVTVVFGTSASSEGTTMRVESGTWGPLQYVGVGMVALGLVAIVAGTVSFLSYRSEESDLRGRFNDAEEAARGCASDSPPTTTCGKNIDTREQLRRLYNENEADGADARVFWLATGVGGLVLVGGGIVLVAIAPKSSAPVKAAPVITPHFAGLMLGGSF
jgi:hypothetical protein